MSKEWVRAFPFFSGYCTGYKKLGQCSLPWYRPRQILIVKVWLLGRKQLLTTISLNGFCTHFKSPLKDYHDVINTHLCSPVIANEVEFLTLFSIPWPFLLEGGRSKEWKSNQNESKRKQARCREFRIIDEVDQYEKGKHRMTIFLLKFHVI